MSTLNLPPADRTRKPDHTLRVLFRQAIGDTGLSRAEIARRAGYSKSTITYMLNGTHEGKLGTWSDVLDAAGVEIGYRIKGDGHGTRTRPGR